MNHLLPADVSDDSASVSSAVSNVSSITMEPALASPRSIDKTPEYLHQPVSSTKKAVKNNKRPTQTMSSPDSIDSDKKETLRKGKWTAEEEQYTNKVIEYFNAGLLKLDSADKIVTLRSYLSEKLQCDPMRITKKFTGAACLGKRVYHFDRTTVAAEDVDKAMRELELLEKNFRTKLEQASKKRTHEESATRFDESLMVSTPAIDALVKRHRAEKESRSAASSSSTSTNHAAPSSSSCSSGSAIAQVETVREALPQTQSFVLPALPQQVLQQQQLLYFQKIQEMHALQLSRAQNIALQIPSVPLAVQLKQLQQLAMLNRDLSFPQ